MTTTNGVRRVPGLGTTWNERGPRYWVRRALISLGLAVVNLFVITAYCGVAVGLLTAATSFVARALIIIVFIAAAVWSFASVLRASRPARVAMRTKDATALRTIIDNIAKKRAGGTVAGTGFGVGSLAGNSVATGILAIGVVFIIGWPIMMLLLSFRRHYSVDECLAVIERDNTNRAGGC